MRRLEIAMLQIALVIAAAQPVFAQGLDPQIEQALQNRICPADLRMMDFLDYENVCGATPSSASQSYLRCQNNVDAQNNRISAYNDFIRNCQDADRRTNDLLNQRKAGGSNEAPAQQSELARAAEEARRRAAGSEQANQSSKAELSTLKRQRDEEDAKQTAAQEAAARQAAAAEAAAAAEEERARAEARNRCRVAARDNKPLICCGSLERCISECRSTYPSSRTCSNTCNGDIEGVSQRTTGCFWGR